MAFVAEDGTGLADANSLCDLAFADAYFTDRGIVAWTATTVTQAAKEGALIRATDYVEGRWANRFLGEIQFDVQALSFPRTGLLINNVSADGTVPIGIKKAVAEYAVRALTTTLAPDPVVDSSGLLLAGVREKVGPIETETRYQTGAFYSNGTFRPYPAADMLIKPFVYRTGGLVRA